MSQVAMITGASRGIGAATARVLAERGFRVVVNHRASGPQADEVVAAITAAGGEAMAIQAAVTVPADLVAPATVSGTTVTGQLTSERMHELGAAVPMGRLVTPDEVANAIAFLSSAESGFTTGHYLPINGGLAMD